MTSKKLKKEPMKKEDWLELKSHILLKLMVFIVILAVVDPVGFVMKAMITEMRKPIDTVEAASIVDEIGLNPDEYLDRYNLPVEDWFEYVGSGMLPYTEEESDRNEMMNRVYKYIIFRDKRYEPRTKEFMIVPGFDVIIPLNN